MLPPKARGRRRLPAWTTKAANRGRNVIVMKVAEGGDADEDMPPPPLLPPPPLADDDGVSIVGSEMTVVVARE